MIPNPLCTDGPNWARRFIWPWIALYGPCCGLRFGKSTEWILLAENCGIRMQWPSLPVLGLLLLLRSWRTWRNAPPGPSFIRSIKIRGQPWIFTSSCLACKRWCQCTLWYTCFWALQGMHFIFGCETYSRGYKTLNHYLHGEADIPTWQCVRKDSCDTWDMTLLYIYK